MDRDNFDTDGVIKNFNTASEKSESEVPISPVCHALLEFTKLFGRLGPLGFAFSDVTTKCEVLLAHEKTYGEQISGFFSLIELEGKKGLQRLNGENNKSETKDKTLWTYTSGSRTLLRMMWFMDFLYHLFTDIFETTDKISTCCRRAYEKSLEPHHPFVVRTAAKAAWLAAPGRDKFYSACFGKTKSEPEIFECFKNVVTALTPLRKKLWNYYETNKLTELP